MDYADRNILGLQVQQREGIVVRSKGTERRLCGMPMRTHRMADLHLCGAAEVVIAMQAPEYQFSSVGLMW